MVSLWVILLGFSEMFDMVSLASWPEKLYCVSWGGIWLCVGTPHSSPAWPLQAHLSSLHPAELLVLGQAQILILWPGTRFSFHFLMVFWSTKYLIFFTNLSAFFFMDQAFGFIATFLSSTTQSHKDFSKSVLIFTFMQYHLLQFMLTPPSASLNVLPRCIVTYETVFRI